MWATTSQRSRQTRPRLLECGSRCRDSPAIPKGDQIPANFHRAIRYAPLFSFNEADLAPWGELIQMRLVAFPDARFGSPKYRHVVEGAFIAHWEAVARDGPIQCRGYIIGRRRAKIHRGRRSPLSSEIRAEIPAAGQPCGCKCCSRNWPRGSTTYHCSIIRLRSLYRIHLRSRLPIVK